MSTVDLVKIFLVISTSNTLNRIAKEAVGYLGANKTEKAIQVTSHVCTWEPTKQRRQSKWPRTSVTQRTIGSRTLPLYYILLITCVSWRIGWAILILMWVFISVFIISPCEPEFCTYIVYIVHSWKCNINWTTHEYKNIKRSWAIPIWHPSSYIQLIYKSACFDKCHSRGVYYKSAWQQVSISWKRVSHLHSEVLATYCFRSSSTVWYYSVIVMNVTSWLGYFPNGRC